MKDLSFRNEVKKCKGRVEKGWTIMKCFLQIWDSESSVAGRYHMEVFHLEILGFPETEASEDLLQAQPEADFWDIDVGRNGKSNQPLWFPIDF